MVKRALNDRMLKSLKPAEPGKRYEVMDSVVPGFGVRVTSAGQKTFVLVARFPGSKNPTRRAIGSYGAITLDKAARPPAIGWNPSSEVPILEKRRNASERTSYANAGTPLPAWLPILFATNYPLNGKDAKSKPT
jgi:Arm DNA-binding domain